MPECSKTSASLNTAARTPSKNAEFQRSRRAQEHFLLVKDAVLARHDEYTIGAGRNRVQMQTWEALLDYAKKPPERFNDLFAIIWNAADEQTKRWIEQGLLARDFEKNDQNKARWDKMQLLPAQASRGAAQSSVFREGQDATNPYIVFFVSTARPPAPVLASNSRAVVF